MEIDQESAVAQFLEISRACQAQQLTAAEVMREIIRFYKEVRVSGANFDVDGDMLLFQWGAGKHPILPEPKDLRGIDDDEVQFDSTESQYLDFTRQVFAAGDEDDADFDDSAIQMSITCIYGPARGDEESGDLWIPSPTRIEYDVKKHASQPLVSQLLDQRWTRIIATVGFCG
ncbi:MAG TPA: hypothetical protein VMV10_27870 [Pirellulales bacterium]|nr:hypothetical protein [Pirellulales bacterium]